MDYLVPMLGKSINVVLHGLFWFASVFVINSFEDIEIDERLNSEKLQEILEAYYRENKGAVPDSKDRADNDQENKSQANEGALPGREYFWHNLPRYLEAQKITSSVNEQA